MMRRIRRTLEPVDSVLDVGCGIRPLNPLQVGPGRMYALDIWMPYLRRAPKPWRLVLADLRSTLPFRRGSFDLVTAWDVIEHLERPDALRLLKEALRVAQDGVLIGTPLGFQAQEGDAWGLGGGEWQRHRSGWTPDDFPDAEETWLIEPDPSDFNRWYHQGWWAAWLR